MIEFKHVNKRFGHLQVLKDVNLKIEKGTCVVFIGPNGCGKTTLLKCMLNMVIPDSGKITIRDIDVQADHESRRNLGFMPQIGHFPENMTINEVIDTVRSVRGHQTVTDYELYNLFDIKSIGDKKMSTLSGGTVQKVSASIAFLFNPEIIVMDEPFAGLDILAADILKRKILREKEKGKTILMTSHTFSEIDEVVSHVVFIDNSVILFYKTLHELLASTGQNNVTDAVMASLKNKV